MSDGTMIAIAIVFVGALIYGGILRVADAIRSKKP